MVKYDIINRIKPELWEKEVERGDRLNVLVVGNGFDLVHGLTTKFL